MSLIRETVFDLLLNALLQISVLALLAASFSRFAGKARAKHQFSFYLAALLFCLAIPAINTLWHFPSAPVPDKSQALLVPGAGGANSPSWIWQGHSGQHTPFAVPPRFEAWIAVMWGLFLFARVIRFSLALYRVRRLRRDASALSPAQAGMERRMLGADSGIALLESTAIDVPVTIGVFHPAILLPSKLLPELGEEDLSAILAHEYGHIRRRDFPIHMLCELISMPVAWHPGIRYLMAKISETRELACDEYAAARLGKRRAYAKTLLRLASLCLNVRRASAVALGIFNRDNLETRIMMLTQRTLALSRTGVIGLALAASITFCVGAALMHTVSLQASAEPSVAAENFAGTWHWMFNGKDFATMVLVRSGSRLTGSVTGSRVALKDNGELLRADPSENPSPNPIASAQLEGSALHVTMKDGFEFRVTLKDSAHAEIRPVGAPPNLKPIPAEKVH